MHCNRLSANILGKRIPKESKAEWDRRWKCEILLFYDWSSTRDTMTASKLTVLKKILIEVSDIGYTSWAKINYLPFTLCSGIFRNQMMCRF